MENIQAGLLNKVSLTVEQKDTANAYGSGGLDVFATPGMIALMECTAYGLLQKRGIESVGTELQVQHTRACLPGTTVWAVAEITAIEGKRVLFNITVSDDQGEIGKGTHVRYRIDPEKFMAKLHK